jgi:hypothetical protein
LGAEAEVEILPVGTGTLVQNIPAMPRLSPPRSPGDQRVPLGLALVERLRSLDTEIEGLASGKRSAPQAAIVGTRRAAIPSAGSGWPEIAEPATRTSPPAATAAAARSPVAQGVAGAYDGG